MFYFKDTKWTLRDERGKKSTAAMTVTMMMTMTTTMTMMMMMMLLTSY